MVCPMAQSLHGFSSLSLLRDYVGSCLHPRLSLGSHIHRNTCSPTISLKTPTGETNICKAWHLLHTPLNLSPVFRTWTTGDSIHPANSLKSHMTSTSITNNLSSPFRLESWANCLLSITPGPSHGHLSPRLLQPFLRHFQHFLSTALCSLTPSHSEEKPNTPWSGKATWDPDSVTSPTSPPPAHKSPPSSSLFLTF